MDDRHDPLDTDEKMEAAVRRWNERLDAIIALLDRKARGEITQEEYWRLYRGIKYPWEVE